jgi:cytochrome bd-type quinol oxidase subunit 2
MFGYWVGVLGTVVPGIVLTSCIIWLRRERRRGESTARVFWLAPLLVLSVILLAFMVVFPML